MSAYKTVRPWSSVIEVLLHTMRLFLLSLWRQSRLIRRNPSLPWHLCLIASTRSLVAQEAGRIRKSGTPIRREHSESRRGRPQGIRRRDGVACMEKLQEDEVSERDSSIIVIGSARSLVWLLDKTALICFWQNNISSIQFYSVFSPAKVKRVLETTTKESPKKSKWAWGLMFWRLESP